MKLNFHVLEELIAEQMQTGKVPGLALAIIQEMETTYSRGFGVTSVEDGAVPITAQTLFRIGSITKSMTATAILNLVESGKLDLDRPVVQYVPWLLFSEEGAAEQITPRMLLSHTAGLPTSHTPFGRRELSGLKAYVQEDVPSYPFVAPPGKLYSYSNPGIRLAGYIAEVVSGQPYTELIQRLVFDPLEMGRTTFDPTVAMTYPVAQSHDLEEDGGLRVQHRFADDTGGYPSGGVISSALDLTHFATMQMNGGCYWGRRILAPESVAEMQRIHAEKHTTSHGGYGLGLAVDRYKGIRRVGHEGSISTFGSRLVMAPTAGTAVVFLFNRAPGFWTRAEAITDGILDQLLDLPRTVAPPEGIEPDRARWPLYRGTYLGDWRGLAIVEVQGGQLMLEWNGEKLALNALRGDLYSGRKPVGGDTVSVGFVSEGEEPVQYIQVNSSPCRRVYLDTAWVLDPGTWIAYAGKYRGVEALAVRIVEDRLLVYSDDVDREMSCVPLSNSCFACDVGLVEFHVAEDGSVPSVKLGKVYTLRRE